jgi:hypothetical protein
VDGPSSISLETPEGVYPCPNPDFTLVKNICCCPVCDNLSQSHKELKEKVRNETVFICNDIILHANIQTAYKNIRINK